MSKDEQPDMLVDHREPQRIVDKLSSKGLSIKVKELGVGDYVWGDTAIERKTLKDFISSIMSSGKNSPRIWRQAKGMSENFDRNHVVVIGTSLDMSYKKRYRTNVIYGTIAALETGFGLHVDRVENESEFIDFVMSLYNRGKKGTDRPYPSTPASAPFHQKVENMFCQVPRVGVKTARKILKNYKSVNNLTEELDKDENKVKDELGNCVTENLKEALFEEVEYD